VLGLRFKVAVPGCGSGLGLGLRVMVAIMGCGLGLWVVG